MLSFVVLLIGCALAASETQEIASFIQQSNQVAAQQKEKASALVKACQTRLIGNGGGLSSVEQHSSKKAPQSLKNTESALKIFVSSSMPKESLKALHYQASKIGVRLVFRGLINNSFKDTQVFFTELAIAGEIDPPAFDQFKITAVPTFVLTQDHKCDAIQGNISLDEALSQFSEKGELKEKAFKLKVQLGAHS
jgi:type-F conjugative transfer system pilin assembly protein TrbC